MPTRKVSQEERQGMSKSTGSQRPSGDRAQGPGGMDLGAVEGLKDPREGTGRQSTSVDSTLLTMASENTLLKNRLKNRLYPAMGHAEVAATEGNQVRNRRNRSIFRTSVTVTEK